MNVADGATYSDLIVQALTRYPDRAAFVIGDRCVTYAEAADATRLLMGGLADRGVGLGSSVAMLSPNSPESWLVQAATYLLGASFTGLQALGSLDDHVYVIDDATASVLFVHESFAEHGQRIQEKSQSLKHVLVVAADGHIEELADASPLDLDPGPAGPEDVAWLQYTGGTTGRSKGVRLPQRAMVAQALTLTASWGLPEEPRYLAAGPITHASVLPVLPTLIRGGTVVLLPGFDPVAWFQAVNDHRINYGFAVPTMIYALLATPTPDGIDLSSLETIAYGAAPMSPSRLIEAQERFGRVFMQVYGQTENAGMATSLRRDEHRPDSIERLASCGRAVAGVRVAILDDDGNEVPPGEVGELAVRSRTAMLGYHNLPAETAEVMVNGWLRSGDMARTDQDGFIYVVDRKKDMIISGGFNIYAREVEDVLTSHPDVAAAAVIGIPDDKWGEAVMAFVVARPGAAIDPGAITSHVREAKGPLHTPKAIEAIDTLPMTTVGKVDKTVLRAPYWSDQDRQVH